MTQVGRFAVGAVFLDAVGVDLQRMVVNGKPPFLGDTGLAFFDFGVEEFLDLAALNADQMVVVVALVELEHRLVAVEVVAHQQSRLLELGEHAIDRGQTDVLALVGQQAIDLFCGHVALLALLEQIQDFQARQGGFQADALEVGWIAQMRLQNGNANTL